MLVKAHILVQNDMLESYKAREKTTKSELRPTVTPHANSLLPVKNIKKVTVAIGLITHFKLD